MGLVPLAHIPGKAKQLEEDQMASGPCQGVPGFAHSPISQFQLTGTVVLVPRTGIWTQFLPHSSSPASLTSLHAPSVSHQEEHPMPTRAVAKPSQVCWCCRKAGHSQDQCFRMKVGTLIWFPDVLQASPD